MDFATLLVSVFSVMIGGGGLAYLGVSLGKLYKSSFQKINDAEILRLTGQLGKINSKILAQNSPLNKTEASLRIGMLVNTGTLQTLYTDMGRSYYTLRENLGLQLSHLSIAEKHEGSTEDLARLASETGNHFSVAHICITQNCSIIDAKKILKRWKSEGLVEGHYSQDFMSKYYSLASVHLHLLKNISSSSSQLSSVIANSMELPKPSITDAAVIKEAIERNGKLSVASLSLAFEIEVDQAKKLLEKLHEKEIFEIQVNTNGTIEYWLIDQSLLNE